MSPRGFPLGTVLAAPRGGDTKGVSTFRLTLSLLILLVAGTATAQAAPLSDLSADYRTGVLDVRAAIDSPPAASGCRAAVVARWAPAGSTMSAASLDGSAEGMVNKTQADGAVDADTCQELGAKAMWTRGHLTLQFRPQGLDPGRYRVCVRADLALRDGRRDAHAACTGFTVPVPGNATSSERKGRRPRG